MLCERCKIREANIQYTEVVNGVVTEHNFCSQCARELDLGQYSSIFGGSFPFSRLISGLLGAEEKSPEDEKLSHIACPTCGLTYDEFVKGSTFGCADCYGVFDVLIHDNIKQLQGSDIHKGKRPIEYRNINLRKDESSEESLEDILKKDPVKDEISSLERQLKEAVKEEEYEQAASLRDRIKALKEEMKTDE